MTNTVHGFLFGFSFDANGARDLRGFDDPPLEGERLRWLHLDWRAEESRRWLLDQAGVDPVAAEAALEGTVRPRVTRFGDALLIVLRAANFEVGRAREDLVSLRILAQANLLVTLRRTRVRSAEDVRNLVLAHPAAFRDSADLLASLSSHVQDRLQGVLEDLADKLDDFEDRIADPKQSPERSEIADLRRSFIALRKSLVPQREALARLSTEAHPLLGRKHEKELHEEALRAARLVDEVESSRERALVLMEEMAVQSTEELNRRIYFFTVIAAIFLPLTFVAGALGMNVGGIPFSDHPQGFLAVSGLLGGIGILIWLLLRRRRWV